MSREDPACPECDEPVGAIESYCLHCGAELDAADDETAVSVATVDLGDASGTDDTGAGDTPSARWPGLPDRFRHDRRGLHPDSLLDDVSTAAVGIVTGVVVGSLAMVLVLFGTGNPEAFLVGPVTCVGVALHVARTRTVFSAVRKA